MISPAVPREEAAALPGVPVDASAPVVQRADLRAARRTHPDVLPDAAEPALVGRPTRTRGVTTTP